MLEDVFTLEALRKALINRYNIEEEIVELFDKVPDFVKHLYLGKTAFKTEYIIHDIKKLFSYDFKQRTNEVIYACIATYATTINKETKDEMLYIIAYIINENFGLIDKKVIDMIFDPDIKILVPILTEDNFKSYLLYRLSDEDIALYIIDKCETAMSTYKISDIKSTLIMQLLLLLSMNKDLTHRVYQKIFLIGTKYIEYGGYYLLSELTKNISVPHDIKEEIKPYLKPYL
jgi:hypothetical protein